jgi:hypothetical protein
MVARLDGCRIHSYGTLCEYGHAERASPYPVGPIDHTRGRLKMPSTSLIGAESILYTARSMPALSDINMIIEGSKTND